MTDIFINCLYVGFGGALGSIARYLMGLLPINVANGFPATTLAINFIGAFLIGIVVGLGGRSSLSPQMLLLLKVGVCGGFTTFSTFSLESYDLLSDGNWLVAGGYIAASIVLCIAGVALASWLVGKVAA